MGSPLTLRPLWLRSSARYVRSGGLICCPLPSWGGLYPGPKVWLNYEAVFWHFDLSHG